MVPAQAESVPEHWPDFAGRRQKIFGKRVLSGADFVIEEAVAFEYLRGQQFLCLPLSLYLSDRHSSEAERRMTSRPAELLRCPAPCRMDARGPAFTFFGKRSLPSRRGSRLPNWKRDLGSGLWLKIDLPGSVWDSWAELARRHGPRLGIRTLDSLQVAAAPGVWSQSLLDLR
jgi:hypothetical protein